MELLPGCSQCFHFRERWTDLQRHCVKNHGVDISEELGAKSCVWGLTVLDETSARPTYAETPEEEICRSPLEGEALTARQISVIARAQVREPAPQHRPARGRIPPPSMDSRRVVHARRVLAGRPLTDPRPSPRRSPRHQPSSEPASERTDPRAQPRHSQRIARKDIQMYASARESSSGTAHSGRETPKISPSSSTHSVDSQSSRKSRRSDDSKKRQISPLLVRIRRPTKPSATVSRPPEEPHSCETVTYGEFTMNLSLQSSLSSTLPVMGTSVEESPSRERRRKSLDEVVGALAGVAVAVAAEELETSQPAIEVPILDAEKEPKDEDGDAAVSEYKPVVSPVSSPGGVPTEVETRAVSPPVVVPIPVAVRTSSPVLIRIGHSHAATQTDIHLEPSDVVVVIPRQGGYMSVQSFQQPR